MNNKTVLQQRDAQVLWHPCSQMKDYESFPPVEVYKAKGAHLYLKDGKKVLDAISSWWCKCLGHGHPRLKAALQKQLKQFEHVILANTTNDVIVNLSERLTKFTKRLTKVFYASEGSSAVEIALKMSLHSRKITGEIHRNKFLSLQNGYHGETLLALSVSDVGLYRLAYESVLIKTDFIQNVPYISSREVSGWNDCSSHWLKIEDQLTQYKENLTAIILEPIVQGSAGMLIYSQDFLARLRNWCRQHGIHLIADEIMTGFGRTGKMFGFEHANIEPDFVCLGKGMTGGFLPMSAVLINEEIYQLFYRDYEEGQSFLHSHTHCGNALAAAVATEVLTIFEEERICDQVCDLEKQLGIFMAEVESETTKLLNIRWIGGVAAADLKVSNANDRAGYQVYKKAVELGALLRPLGNTVYWLPPLTIKKHELKRLRDITIKAIKDVLC